MNGYIPETWYFRGFDAWVNDKLADLFSDSYHFLGNVIGTKYSWIAAAEINTQQIEEITVDLGYDALFGVTSDRDVLVIRLDSTLPAGGTWNAG